MSNVVIRSKEDVAFIASGALLSLWVFWVNSNSHAAGSAGSYLHPYLFSSLFAFAIAALAPRLNLTTRTIRIGDASAAILGFAASLLVSMTASRATPQWLLAFMAIGLSSVWFQTRMHMRLLSQNLFDVLRFSLMSSIVYGLLGWSLSLLSDTGAVLVGLISPLACAACLHQLPLDPPKNRRNATFPVRLASWLLAPLPVYVAFVSSMPQQTSCLRLILEVLLLDRIQARRFPHAHISSYCLYLYLPTGFM